MIRKAACSYRTTDQPYVWSPTCPLEKDGTFHSCQFEGQVCKYCYNVFTNDHTLYVLCLEEDREE